MPLKYKAIQKTEPGVKGGGKKKWYASTTDRDEVTVDQLAREVERLSSLSLADSRAAIIALTEILPDHLLRGAIVRLGELGSFRINISSTGVDKEAEVTANIITDARINYTPGDRLKEMLGNVEYQKM